MVEPVLMQLLCCANHYNLHQMVMMLVMVVMMMMMVMLMVMMMMVMVMMDSGLMRRTGES